MADARSWLASVCSLVAIEEIFILGASVSQPTDTGLTQFTLAGSISSRGHSTLFIGNCTQTSTSKAGKSGAAPVDESLVTSSFIPLALPGLHSCSQLATRDCRRHHWKLLKAFGLEKHQLSIKWTLGTTPDSSSSKDLERPPDSCTGLTGSVPIWMASLGKAGAFLKRLFRHHITVPDGREAVALIWPPSLGNALDQTALLGCFCLKKVKERKKGRKKEGNKERKKERGRDERKEGRKKKKSIQGNCSWYVTGTRSYPLKAMVQKGQINNFAATVT
ncbi:E3 Ubiquitin-Protein Ligase Rnf19B [Manis pentadactyla]|nr:E3 Ubiquitin-Protein Ligase Rnf19B [Manis pentadactyla]